MYGYHDYYYAPYRQAYLHAWTSPMVDLNRALRTLWVQHVYWTRLTVNSIVDRLADEQATTARLLRNPSDFAAALKPFYGPDIASEFARLLTAHLTIAVEVVKALQASDAKAAEDAQKRWYANADDIAKLLGRINPYWSEQDWKNMLYEHLRLLTQEVATRLAGNYTENVALGDPIEAQALDMADVMTKGIIQQFPSAFAA